MSEIKKFMLNFQMNIRYAFWEQTFLLSLIIGSKYLFPENGNFMILHLDIHLCMYFTLNRIAVCPVLTSARPGCKGSTYMNLFDLTIALWISTVIISIFHLREPRHREFERLAPNCTACNAGPRLQAQAGCLSARSPYAQLWNSLARCAVYLTCFPDSYTCGSCIHF